MAEQGIRIEVVRGIVGQRGFAVEPRRWVVERISDRVRGWLLARLGRSRRVAEDCERRLRSAEAMIELPMIHLVPRRLG